MIAKIWNSEEVAIKTDERNEYKYESGFWYDSSKGKNEIRINIIAIYSPVTAKKYGCKLKKKIGNINGKLDLDLNKLKRLFSENISQAIKNTENVDAINETSGFVKRKEIRFHK